VQKKITTYDFLHFPLQLLLGISKKDFISLFSHPMCTYWYYHNLISLLYFKIIIITVMHPSDFSVLKTHS